MEGYKYEVQVELTPGDPVISAQGLPWKEVRDPG